MPEDNLHPSRIVAGITKAAARKAAQTFVDLLDENPRMLEQKS